MFYHQQLGRKA